MYNLGDEDDDDDGGVVGKGKVEENDKTKEKMKIIRTKMENLTINRAKVAATVPHKQHKVRVLTNIYQHPNMPSQPHSIKTFAHEQKIVKLSR